MFIYSHSWAWLVLIFLMLNASYLRHFFNLRHQGISRPSILIISSALFVVIATVGDRLASSSLDAGNEISSNLLSDQEMMLLVQQHCGNCHANKPSFPGYAVAPGGIVLDSLQALDGYRAATLSSLKSGYMPLGNMQGLTDMQRNEMIYYLQQ